MSIHFDRKPSDQLEETTKHWKDLHNGTISLGASDVNNSAKGSFERWINTVKAEEVGFATRMYRLNQLNSKPKNKTKTSCTER